MGIYSLAQRTTATAAASANWEVRAAATNAPLVMELSFFQVTAVAGVFGIGRPAAIGVTPTTPVQVLAEGVPPGAAGLPTGLSQAALAWGTGPTVPTAFNRRIACAATIGVGGIFVFPRGFMIPASGSIVLWIIATAPVCDVNVVVDE